MAGGAQFGQELQGLVAGGGRRGAGGQLGAVRVEDQLQRAQPGGQAGPVELSVPCDQSLGEGGRSGLARWLQAELVHQVRTQLVNASSAFAIVRRWGEHTVNGLEVVGPAGVRRCALPSVSPGGGTGHEGRASVR